jgi:hypothetical protein
MARILLKIFDGLHMIYTVTIQTQSAVRAGGYFNDDVALSVLLSVL